MSQVNYDKIASNCDQRYETNRFDGILAVLIDFVGAPEFDVLEVGCGTGQWLNSLRPDGRITGLDPSAAMLVKARERAPRAFLTRARAESLPFAAGTFDRVLCVNALHHLEHPRAFFLEARRVLRPRGGVLTIGLDPHSGTDSWWIYDYFPAALSADLGRYPSTQVLRTLLREAHFAEATTVLAQHIPAAMAFETAVDQGFLDRRSTSQLQVIDDETWESGRLRLFAERPELRADLRLWATIGWIRESDASLGA